MYSFLVVSFLLVLNGCANISLEAEATSVKIYYALTERSTCDYLGDVVGSDGNMLTFWFMSNDKLTRGALNDIRNEAREIGGNTVFILRDQLQYTTSTTFVASVYHCNK